MKIPSIRTYAAAERISIWHLERLCGCWLSDEELTYKMVSIIRMKTVLAKYVVVMVSTSSRKNYEKALWCVATCLKLQGSTHVLGTSFLIFFLQTCVCRIFLNSWTQVHFYSYYIIHYAALNYNGFLEFNSQIFD